MARWQHSLALKIAVANIFLVSVAVLTAVGVRYRSERRLLETTIRQELIQTVSFGALLLEGPGVEALVAAPDSPESQRLAAHLRSLQKANKDLTRIYLLPCGGRKAPLLVFEREKALRDMSTPPPPADMELCSDAALAAAPSVSASADGQWLSAWRALRDPEGKVAAILGADLRASDLKAEAKAKLRLTVLTALAAGAVGILLSFPLARGVTKPLKLVAESTAEIAAGNLNIYLNMRQRDEVGELADSFNRMVERLAAASEERDRLHQQLMEKQKLEQELSLAAEIQRSFLPVSFPQSSCFRTFARTVPAEVVGGDFYDFVEVSEPQHGIAIGDVAGRGIGAAVYLARLISDFRAAAMRAEGPRDALERLNRQLLARSTRGLFVTMTYLVLDDATGRVCYSTAGHPPMLRRRAGTGAIEVLSEGSGLPLGITSRPSLGEQSLKLEAGEILLMVTDGVLEALSSDHRALNLTKLEEILRGAASADDHLVDAVFEEAGRLSSTGSPQDDMTVLAIACLKTARPGGNL